MIVKGRKLNLLAVAMMNVVIVASLQMMTATAVYGYALIFFYFLAVLFFFIPCMLIISELSTAHPITGGGYVWVEKAFGKRWGFFTVGLQWLCNLIWYPTIFSLIATMLAYLAAPDLASQKSFTLGAAIVFFWLITLVNSFGIRVSSFVSTISAIVGIILPVLVLIGFGIAWVWQEDPRVS
jgi:glutamate:GABA antiporter